ncbi:MAG: hypothetical protein LDL51_05960 [Chloroflexi bacterium]|nr:hypothetical protein [Chloroflexota bacterium]
MSDLTLVAEDILNAIRAMEEAYQASQALRERADNPAFDEFRARMLSLQERLEKIKIVLDNEEAFAVDELVDAISLAYSGHRAEYRRTPRMRER